MSRFRAINFMKCDQIYKEMQEKHMEEQYIESLGVTHAVWATPAVEIEAELSLMAYAKKITHEEAAYIFGMIATQALKFRSRGFYVHE